MTDNDSLRTLSDWLRSFCAERDWDQFHSPKDLAIGIDLGRALERKMAKNARKYPADQCRGDNRKR